MLYSIKNRDGLKNLNELVSLENQVKELRLQDNLAKQNFHDDGKKISEPVNDTIKRTSEYLTKTITETSIRNSPALEGLHEKVVGIMNDKGMIAPYLASPLAILLKPENKGQYNIIKDQKSIKMKDFLITTSIPVTLYSTMLTFRDTNETFISDGDLLKLMTNYNLLVDHSNLRDRKILYEFGKEMKCDI